MFKEIISWKIKVDIWDMFGLVVKTNNREKLNKTVSYNSLTHTLHSQDPLGRSVRQLRHTWWLHILHWLEEKLSRLRGCWHLPQLCGLYLPLPRLAPFLFTSSSSTFNFLGQNNIKNWGGVLWKDTGYSLRLQGLKKYLTGIIWSGIVTAMLFVISEETIFFSSLF